MYTSEQINQIMQELGLSPTDASTYDTRKLIEQLANSKPQVAIIDASFISELRQDLQNRAAHASAPEKIEQAALSTQSTHQTNLFSSFMNKSLAGALIVAVIVIGAGGVWYAKNSDTPLLNNSTFGGGSQLLSGKYDVESVANESFGNLDKVAIVNANDAAKLNSSNNSASMTAGLGGSNNYKDNPNLSGQQKEAMSASMGEDAKLIAPGEPYPGQVYYSFKYEGDKTLPGLEATQPVLKRTKPVQPAGLVSRVVSFLSFGLIDLSTLQNAQLQNLSFVEDREFGYGVSVDVTQGMISMYQNYEKWPMPDYTGCMEGICNSLRSPEDLPADADVIAATETFIQQYKISKEGYGTPRVIETWRAQYELARSAGNYSSESPIYIPEQVQVVYPLILEGKEVFDESGNVYGFNVMVDARTMRVTNAYDIISKQFQRSEYKGENDSKRVLDIATNGGFRNYNYPDQQIGKKVELNLGTPTVQMVKIYYSSDNYKTSDDLYMPALVFPIKNWKETGYWRQTVMVPLVKSILDTDIQPQQPIPLDNVKIDPAATTNSIEPIMAPIPEGQGE